METMHINKELTKNGLHDYFNGEYFSNICEVYPEIHCLKKIYNEKLGIIDLLKSLPNQFIIDLAEVFDGKYIAVKGSNKEKVKTLDELLLVLAMHVLPIQEDNFGEYTLEEIREWEKGLKFLACADMPNRGIKKQWGHEYPDIILIKSKKKNEWDFKKLSLQANPEINFKITN